MNPDIDNVVMETTGSHPSVLASSGVCTCVAVVILLREDEIFIAHVDPTEIISSLGPVDVVAQEFIEHCVEKLYENKPGFAIDAVYLIGGRDMKFYHDVSQCIDRFRTSLSVDARSNRVTTYQLRDFLSKIKSNLTTFNIRRRRTRNTNGEEEEDDEEGNGSDSAHDYVSDCAVVYDRASIPARFLIAQRAGEERELHGEAPLTSPFVIYKVDVTSSQVSAITYAPLYQSPLSSVLVETVRRNVIDRSAVFHRSFDLADDDEDLILLSRVKKPRDDDDSDVC